MPLKNIIQIFHSKKMLLYGLVTSLLLLSFHGCDKTSSKPFTVGVVIALTAHTPCIDGFKAGMAELGYIESKNIIYIYNGPIENKQDVIDTEIKNLLSKHIDILFITGQPTLRAKKLLAGTNIPIVFSAAGYVRESGLVENITHPEGNITGVQVANTLEKAIDWLKTVKPDAKKIYIPYNPDDINSGLNLAFINNNKIKLGLEFIDGKVFTVEEAVSAIEKLPEDIDAILRFSSPTLDYGNNRLSAAAIKRRIPMISSVPLDEDVLLTFTSDFYKIGRQAARLAHQVRQGVKTSDLPIETAEAFMTINLKTAQKTGINIPDIVLVQAQKIIR